MSYFAVIFPLESNQSFHYIDEAPICSPCNADYSFYELSDLVTCDRVCLINEDFSIPILSGPLSGPLPGDSTTSDAVLKSFLKLCENLNIFQHNVWKKCSRS